MSGYKMDLIGALLLHFFFFLFLLGGGGGGGGREFKSVLNT